MVWKKVLCLLGIAMTVMAWLTEPMAEILGSSSLVQIAPSGFYGGAGEGQPLVEVETVPAENGLPQASRPNIILIVADDLGYGSLGSYGQELIKTPHTDKLSRKGMRFTSFYSGAPSCSPSRASLMTGMHTGHTRIRDNRQLADGGQLPLPSDTVTVARLLQSSGYKTAMIGKWGLGDAGSEGEPSRQGFDYVFGYLNQVLAHNAYPSFLWRNGSQVPLENKVVYQTSHDETLSSGLGSYSTKKVDFAPELLVEEAESFIESNAKNPFFLFFATTAPHENGEAPEGEKYEVPSVGIYESRDWPEPYKRYAALVSHFDDAVGRITEAVEAAGIAENTVILVTSDNGASAGPVPSFFQANGPFRGGKFGLHEGAIRVPMIAYWPEQIPPRSENSTPAAAWDLFPTILEIAGTSQNHRSDGISLLPTLRGGIQPPRTLPLYWENSSGWGNLSGGTMAAVVGRWKALIHPIDLETELYDLFLDPSEENNLAGEHRELIHALGKAMRYSHLEESEFPLLPSEIPLRRWLRWRLKLIFDRGLLFPDSWPARAEGLNHLWREVLATESAARIQHREGQTSEIYANLGAKKDVHPTHEGFATSSRP